ncbi:universal stress protein [Actinoplanes sp. NPDC049265]|uniref:universal stress protein n=1 Tax=Actinoplanes sp. NPDC049265 TaxID=3363902 RepID=UPI003724537E
MSDAPVMRVLVGYDGSVPAGAAIEAGARLLPGAHARVAHVWTPPYASEQLRRRLWRGAGCVDEFVAAVEREGRCEADRIAATGVTLARAAGWPAEPFVARGFGGEGFQLTEMARAAGTDLMVLGARGLSGATAVLGSVSDMAVHYATQPVLVAPYPLLATEYRELAEGPALVGWDGSPGAEAALRAVIRLLPRHRPILAAVDVDEKPPPEFAEAPAVLRLSTRHDHSPAAIAEVLSTAAHDQEAALVVVGSRGRAAVREILLGSVAMATLHRAHRLVLVVPHPSPGEQ